MSGNLKKRFQNLENRKRDIVSGKVQFVNERLAKSLELILESSEEAIQYLLECQQPVSKDYTDKTFAECMRVENQLQSGCDSAGTKIEFGHQGSVTNGSHIRLYSDIDLLSVIQSFYYCQKPLEPRNPYKGDPIKDLEALRNVVEETLELKFPKADVDKTGSKSVAISGGSLARKIDVVVCSWLHTPGSKKGDDIEKGVSVLDTKNSRTISNFPFKHNDELDRKDVVTNGALKNLIRITKSIRYDSDDEINFSSYDIAAVCYNLDFGLLAHRPNDPVALLKALLELSRRICESDEYRNSLMVPNKTRRIFCEDGADIESYKKLVEEMNALAIVAGAS